jgi:hypothetical protein
MVSERVVLEPSGADGHAPKTLEQDRNKTVPLGKTLMSQPGTTAKEKRSFPLWAIATLASGVLLFCCGGGAMLVWIVTWQINNQKEAGSGGDNSKSPQRQTERRSLPQFIPHQPPLLQNDRPVIKVAASELYRDYGQDLIAADAKYLQNRIELSQVSGKIEKDQQGRYYLAALKIRAVKQAGSGARIVSPGAAARSIYEAAANAKYEPALLIYLRPEEMTAFQGVKETDQLLLEARCAVTRKDPNTTPDLVVILEDARLISKTTPMPPPKPVHNPPTSFSVTNPQDAHEWLALAVQEPLEAQSNQLIRTKAREERAKKLAGLPGLHVEWQLVVDSVNATTIFVSSIRSPYAPQGSVLIVTGEESMVKPPVAPSPSRSPRPPANQSPPAVVFFGLPRFLHHNEPWLEKLKKGSVIKVSGQIKAVDSRGRFIVFLADWKINPEQEDIRENNSQKGGENQAGSKTQPPEPCIEVDSFVMLANEYRDNPIAAARRYDGKQVRILHHVGAAEKMEKRADDFWLQEDIGQNVVGATYTGPALTGGTLVPVYGVEYRLSKDGEEQYAKLKPQERRDMDLIGTVKGTRPYAANTFGSTMLQITDCSFVASTRRKNQEEYQDAIEDTKAKREMRGALNLLYDGHKEEARKRFQAIIDKYPNTPTAERAKCQLDKMAK